MLYRSFRYLCRAALGCAFEVRVAGDRHLPSAGPVIVASNHVSLLDPPLIGMVLNRPVHFMAKVELFHLPVVGSLLPRLRAFPVKREGCARSALCHASELLNRGEVLGIFPEGRRNYDGKLSPPRMGVGWLALRTRAPILPVAIRGVETQVCRFGIVPSQVDIRIGKPITLDHYPTATDRLWRLDVSHRVMDSIRELLFERSSP